MTSERNEYYETADFEALFKIDPDFFKFRHIRLLMPTGYFIKIKDRIKNTQDLRKIFLKYKPLKAYYMVSRFLNPSTVGPQTEPETAHNCFLIQDRLVFDIDENPKKNAKKLLKWLKGKYEVEYIALSGQKGIHISIKRPLNCDIQKPLEREAWYKEQNEALITQILNSGIEIDDCVINTRQIVKIPMSLSKGKPCRLITEDEIKTLRLASPVSPRKGNDGNPQHKTKGLEDNGINLPPKPHLAVSNNVLGTKGNYCLFLRFTKLQWKVEKMQYLIRKFSLPDCYVFESDKHVSVVSLKTFSFRRLKKILQFNKSMLIPLLKFNKNLLTMTDLKNFKGIMPGDPNQPMSEGHKDFLRFIGIREFDGLRYAVGSEQVKYATFVR